MACLLCCNMDKPHPLHASDGSCQDNLVPGQQHSFTTSKPLCDPKRAVLQGDLVACRVHGYKFGEEGAPHGWSGSSSGRTPPVQHLSARQDGFPRPPNFCDIAPVSCRTKFPAWNHGVEIFILRKCWTLWFWSGRILAYATTRACQGTLEMSGVGQDRDVRFSWVLGSFKDDLRWGNNARDGRPQVGIFLTSGGTSGSRRHGR